MPGTPRNALETVDTDTPARAATVLTEADMRPKVVARPGFSQALAALFRHRGRSLATTLSRGPVTTCSIVVDRTRAEVSARCDSEAANVLGLHMVHEIATGKRVVAGARHTVSFGRLACGPPCHVGVDTPYGANR